MNVDFGSTANDYTKYRADFPDEFFDRLFADGFVEAGASLADLGTGTATPVYGFALRSCIQNAIRIVLWNPINGRKIRKPPARKRGGKDK